MTDINLIRQENNLIDDIDNEFVTFERNSYHSFSTEEIMSLESDCQRLMTSVNLQGNGQSLDLSKIKQTLLLKPIKKWALQQKTNKKKNKKLK